MKIIGETNYISADSQAALKKLWADGVTFETQQEFNTIKLKRLGVSSAGVTVYPSGAAAEVTYPLSFYEGEIFTSLSSGDTAVSISNISDESRVYPYVAGTAINGLPTNLYMRLVKDHTKAIPP
jgi:hypothetical protein